MTPPAAILVRKEPGPHLTVSILSLFIYPWVINLPLTCPCAFYRLPSVLCSPPHLDPAHILQCGSGSVRQHHSQSPIKAKSPPLHCFPRQEPKSNISSGTCKRKCPCGKTSKPPIVALLLRRPRDTTALPVAHIYLGVQNFFLFLYCVTCLEELSGENVSVLRKGEYLWSLCAAGVSQTKAN